MNSLCKMFCISVGWVSDRLARYIRRGRLIAQVRHERSRLTRLSERELLDMGIDKAAANQESRRELLDIPANRLSQADLPASIGSSELAQKSAQPKDGSLLKA